MTREENLHWLNQEIRTWENECQSKHPIKEALYAARKALEQEPICPSHGIDCEDCPAYDPCGDVISRRAVHIELEKWITYGEYKYSNATKYLYDRIDRLPSVKPQEKTGHWITTRTFMHDGEFYCDKCKCDAPNNEKWDYCPNCGARMESEDSEG